MKKVRNLCITYQKLSSEMMSPTVEVDFTPHHERKLMCMRLENRMCSEILGNEDMGDLADMVKPVDITIKTGLSVLYSSLNSELIIKGEGMGYKDLGKEMSFADLAVSKLLRHNRSVKMMERINKVVSWTNIDALLREYYQVGMSKEGADAYSPLLLLKGLLLQKWFRIPSDPELENQINDRDII